MLFLIPKLQFIFYYIFIQITITNQEEVYCDASHYCDQCTYCGENNTNICDCNFYNGYCQNNQTNTTDFSKIFLDKYNGCISSNNRLTEICGESVINIKEGENNTKLLLSLANFDRYDNSFNTGYYNNHILCYYYFKNTKNDTSISLTATLNRNKTENNNETNREIKEENNTALRKNNNFLIKDSNNSSNNFYIYLIEESYDEEGRQILALSDFLKQGNTMGLEVTYLKDMSIYIDLPNIEFLFTNSIEITFFVNIKESNNVISMIDEPKVNHKNLVYIIVISLCTVVIVILIICLIKGLRKRQSQRAASNQNIQNTANSGNRLTMVPGVGIVSASYMERVKENKKKMEELFKNQLKPKIYNKKDNIRNDTKCTICLEEFKENASQVTVVPCGHIFHFNCFKSWVDGNIFCPRCPNCNYLILGNQPPIETRNRLQQEGNRAPEESEIAYNASTTGFNAVNDRNNENNLGNENNNNNLRNDNNINNIDMIHRNRENNNNDN